jgi:hypothetical protein
MGGGKGDEKDAVGFFSWDHCIFEVSFAFA